MIYNKKVGMIAAADQNNVIGHDEDMPGWKLTDDFRLNFIPKTKGYPVIMGRITAETFGKPLKDRTNIVISRNPALQLPERFSIVGSLEEALQVAGKASGDMIWIIGGGQIYALALALPDLVDEIHLSCVEGEFPAPNGKQEIFFPHINKSKFMFDPAQSVRYSKREAFEKDKGNSHNFTVDVWVRW